MCRKVGWIQLKTEIHINVIANGEIGTGNMRSKCIWMLTNERLRNHNTIIVLEFRNQTKKKSTKKILQRQHPMLVGLKCAIHCIYSIANSDKKGKNPEKSIVVNCDLNFGRSLIMLIQTIQNRKKKKTDQFWWHCTSYIAHCIRTIKQHK